MNQLMPGIETRRLRLRPMTLDDLPSLAHLFADPDVMLYLPTGESRSVEETQVELAYMVDHWRQRGFGVWAVTLRDTASSPATAACSTSTSSPAAYPPRRSRPAQTSRSWPVWPSPTGARASPRGHPGRPALRL